MTDIGCYGVVEILQLANTLLDMLENGMVTEDRFRRGFVTLCHDGGEFNAAIHIPAT